ncbi:unnamed protein product [Gordionus sp. m RMFG-2023]
MILKVWGPGWGCPSIDANSLILMSINKICGNHIIVDHSNITFDAIFNKIPMLIHGKKSIFLNINFIINHFKKQNIDSDTLTDFEILLDSESFINYICQSLYPAIIYTLWIDDVNNKECTRPAYAKNIKAPLGIYVLNRMNNGYKALLAGLFSLNYKALDINDQKFKDMQ